MSIDGISGLRPLSDSEGADSAWAMGISCHCYAKTELYWLSQHRGSGLRYSG